MLFRSNDTATTEIYTDYYTLSLHDALPIYLGHQRALVLDHAARRRLRGFASRGCVRHIRAEAGTRSRIITTGLGRDSAAGSIPPPAKRWGGWRGAEGGAPGGGKFHLGSKSSKSPHPFPLPTARKCSREEGSGEARRVA